MRGEKPGRVRDELEDGGRRRVEGGWKGARERERVKEEEEEEATGRRSSVVCSCLRFVSPLLEIFRGETQKKKHACTHAHINVHAEHSHVHAQGGVFLNLYRAQCRMGELVWQHIQHSAEPTSGQQDVRG